MANRTQKAAMKQKRDAEKAGRASGRGKTADPVDFEDARAKEILEAEAGKGRKAGKPPGKGKAKPAKPAKPAKEAKPAKGKPAKAKAAGKPVPGEHAIEFTDEAGSGPAKPGFMERWRAAREERAKARKLEADRRVAERAAEAERKAKERAEAEAKARKEAEERAAADAAAAAAAEKERRRQERREAAQEAKRQAEMAEAAKQAEAEARKEERRLQRQAERAAIEERERRAAEEAEAEDRRREALRVAAAQEKADAKAAKVAAKAIAAAEAAEAAEAKAAEEPAELEPEMEFQEGAKAVDPSRALVPAGPARKGKGGREDKAAPDSPVDAQADKVAEELARRRSKPVVIVEDEEAPVPRIPKAKREEPAEPLVLGDAVVDEKYQPAAPSPPPPSGLSIPEMFMLVANEVSWDERAEKAKEGRLGGALAGAILLELLQRGRILVQRDRFTVVGEPGDDEAVEAAVAKMRSIRERKGDISSLPHMRRVAKWNRELLEPFKDRLAERGLVRHGHRMHLGMFYRSHVELLDQDAQERLQNKLRRAIAGGGTPEASSILLLGLLDACGRLETIVPDEAMDYNRKRLNGLLGGRDVMGYKVDPQLKGLQEIAVRTILQNVRMMTFGPGR